MSNSGKTGKRRMLAACGIVAAAWSLSGCNSTRVEEPQSPYSATMARPVPTDVYPVIEGKRPAASVQMSNEEAASQEARLTSLGRARAAGRLTEAEYQRRVKELQALAADHGTDTLDEIRK